MYSSRLIQISFIYLLLAIVSTNSMARTHKLIENMTWPEVEAAIKIAPVIIIPIGAAAKEHGLHLPMNTDLIQANYFRDRLLERMDDIIAAPTFTYGYYPAFLEYPGSTSLDLNTSIAFIVDVSRNFHRQGARKIYFLNMGVSTLKSLAIAQKQLRRENIIIGYTDLIKFFNQPEIKKLKQQTRGTHADEMETSTMLYIAPAVVNMDKAKKDDLPDLGGNGNLTRNPHTTEGVYSATGAWGDPTLANKAKGKAIADAFTDYLIKDIEGLV